VVEAILSLGFAGDGNDNCHAGGLFEPGIADLRALVLIGAFA